MLTRMQLVCCAGRGSGAGPESQEGCTSSKGRREPSSRPTRISSSHPQCRSTWKQSGTSFLHPPALPSQRAISCGTAVRLTRSADQIGKTRRRLADYD